MNDTIPKPFSRAVLASLVAGLASALLVSALQPQSLLGGLLFLIAPLPLMLVGFTYHRLVALLAALIACLILDVFVSQARVVIYALTIALPAWLVCEAGLRREKWLAAFRDRQGYLTAGTILICLALYISALILAIALWINSSYDGLRSQLLNTFAEIIRQQHDLIQKSGDSALDRAQLELIGDIYARLLPGLIAIPFFLMIIVSAYLGAKAAHISRQLSRDMPDFREIRLPAPTLSLFLLAVALIFIGDYFLVLGMLLTLTLGLSFIFQGLAVIHFQLRERPGMRWLISASWAMFIVFGVTGLGFALLGIVDHIFDLRKLRQAK